MDQTLLYWHVEIHPRLLFLRKIHLLNLVVRQGSELFLVSDVFQPPRAQLDEVLLLGFLDFRPGHCVCFSFFAKSLNPLASLMCNIGPEGEFILRVVQVLRMSKGVLHVLQSTEIAVYDLPRMSDAASQLDSAVPTGDRKLGVVLGTANSVAILSNVSVARQCLCDAWPILVIYF